MKPECTEHQKRIPELLLGELPEVERQALEAHFATCPQCSSERESYARTVQLLSSAGDEDIPRHFFVYPEERVTPWQLFGRMAMGWRTAVAGFAALALLLCVAAVSRLQLRSDSDGWSLTFGGDMAAVKNEILKTVEERDRRREFSRIQQVKFQIAQLNTELTKRQQAELTAALDGMDSHITRLIAHGDGKVREDSQKLVVDLYRILSLQRARDLEAIDLRLDSAEANNAIASRQTNEILGTLLEVADLGLR